jgi:hypothetical protein
VTTVSQRAERLDIVRDLVVLGLRKGIYHRTELQDEAISERILVRLGDGEPLSYTSIYRYLDVLRFLNLDVSEEYGISDDIVWSPSAKELACRGDANYLTERLSKSEKAILRECIFASDARRQFLSLFCGKGTEPKSQQQFLAEAQSLYVVGVSVKRPPSFHKSLEWPAKNNVEVSFDPDSGKIMRRPTKEFLYTYRYWCLDTNIIEELNIKEAERCGIPKRRSYLLFPSNPKLVITTGGFLELLYSTVGDLRYPQAFPVPWLMYEVCPRENMSVEFFRSMLLRTWQENRQQIHLERGAGGLIEGLSRLGEDSYEHDYSKRYGNHRYYIIVNGTVRSNLILFPKA